MLGHHNRPLTRPFVKRHVNCIDRLGSKEVGRQLHSIERRGRPPPRTGLRRESPSATGALVGPSQGKEFLRVVAAVGRVDPWSGARVPAASPWVSRGGGDGGDRRLPGHRGGGRAG